ncbi:glycoside hydrolase domain-containing protein [Kribbella shirazensis]|uniref:Glycoside hydrolase 123 catalytic domain-containing protein n=1 Tax=Kribbella shirazensis TaxID=1105143 RepID=A0A7X5VCU2_9ACTN|nr:hypothetical protein [Kribbella shirazensis]
MYKRFALVLAAVLALIGVVPAHAASDDVLADFETPDLMGVTLAAPEVDRAAQSTAFATRGNGALRFDIAGSTTSGSRVFPRVWLADGTALTAADWRGRNYLQVGVLNATPEPTTLYVVVRDQAGRYHQSALAAAPFGYRMFRIGIAAIAAAGVDLTKLQHLQVSAARSPSPRTLYVDDIRLTDSLPDEAAEQDRLAPRIIAAMGLTDLGNSVAAALSAVERRMPQSPAPPDRALRATASALRRQLDVYATQIPALGKDVTTARAILAGLGLIQWRIKRLGTSVDARHARPSAPVGLGFADSMALVYPKDLPCQCTWRDGEIQLARGEYENIQLVAAPYQGGLSGAVARVTSVHGPDSGLTVSVRPVASLFLGAPVAPRPGTPTPYRPSLYQGWTPDPILTDRSAVDVAGDDYQAFWVQVHAPAGLRAGQYTVDLALSADGIAPQPARVKVTVWDVTIPDRPVLQTAIGNDPKAYAEPYGVTDPDGIARVNEAKWRFLADFKIQPDNIYRSIYTDGPPTVAELRAVQQRYGGLRRFNVWYFDPRLFDLHQPDTWDAKADALFDLIQPAVDSYRAAGLVDHAYLYCCDETLAAHAVLVKHVLTRFKQRFPDIEVLSTYIDDRMGESNGLSRLIDYWVRDVPWLAPDVIERRRAAGDESWWYLHAGNENPVPNLFVGYDPGQLRTLLGPMSFQAKVDGFLYYRVDRWYGHSVLTDGPLSTWDPRTWGNVAGDGSLFYPGRNGPMPSQRIQNFRDGMEDYNLMVELRRAVDQAPSDVDPEKLALAQRVLTARDVVTNQTTYVRDPAAYRLWRAQVGAVIKHLS